MSINIQQANKEYKSSVIERIVIKRIYDKKLESPYNDCLKDGSQYIINKT